MTFNIDPAYNQNDAATQPGDMFDYPVPVPAANIDDSPLICIEFNEDYAAIIALALERLLYYDAWSGDPADVARVTQQLGSLTGELHTGNC